MVRSLPVPNASTLSRWRFRVDVSYMLEQRARFGRLLERDALLFHVLSDASPQAGREWFVTELHVLSAETMDFDLARLFSSAVSFQRSILSRMASSEEFCQLPLAERERVRQGFGDDRKALAECLSVLVAPPVGLGHRRTNFIHKLHALTHQLYLLFGKKLAAATKQLIAFCTDFGVESNLAKTRRVPLGLLCPYGVDMPLEREGQPPEVPESLDATGADNDDEVQYNTALRSQGHFTSSIT
jgi:hypothetical protein